MVEAHPAYARTCESCREWRYTEQGTIAIGRDGQQEKRRGDPKCSRCPKVPQQYRREKRAWRFAAELTPQMQQAYAFYEECVAVGQFPADPIVRRCAASIYRAVKAADRRKLIAGLAESMQWIMLSSAQDKQDEPRGRRRLN